MIPKLLNKPWITRPRYRAHGLPLGHDLPQLSLKISYLSIIRHSSSQLIIKQIVYAKFVKMYIKEVTLL